MNTTRRNSNGLPMIPVFLTVIGLCIALVISTIYEESWAFSWKGIRTDIKDSIQAAELYGKTSGPDLYFPQSEEITLRRKWVMENATELELLKLIEYPNGTIKALAYEVLQRKKDFNNRTDLTLRAIKDTTYVVLFQSSGCMISEMEIGEYLVQNVLMIDDRIPPYQTLPDFGLSVSDKDKILTEFKKRPN